MSTYELYAVKYATMQARKRKDNFLNPDPHDDAPMPIDYFVWAAVSPERTIVIDTGFDAAEAEARGRTLVRESDRFMFPFPSSEWGPWLQKDGKRVLSLEQLQRLEKLITEVEKVDDVAELMATVVPARRR